MKIYLDNCCYGRYLDDLSIKKNNDELEAISYIMVLCDTANYDLCCSEFSYYEANNNSDILKRYHYLSMLKTADIWIEPSDGIFKRAESFKLKDINPLDGMHLAAAETQCDLFFTVDYRFKNRAQQIKELNIGVYNPLYWVNNKL